MANLKAVKVGFLNVVAGRHPDWVFLLSPCDAVMFIDAATREGYILLGVEGFFITERGAIQQVQEHENDLVDESQEVFRRKTKEFLWAREGISHLYFEVVFEEANRNLSGSEKETEPCCCSARKTLEQIVVKSFLERSNHGVKRWLTSNTEQSAMRLHWESLAVQACEKAISLESSDYEGAALWAQVGILACNKHRANLRPSEVDLTREVEIGLRAQFVQSGGRNQDMVSVFSLERNQLLQMINEEVAYWERDIAVDEIDPFLNPFSERSLKVLRAQGKIRRVLSAAFPVFKEFQDQLPVRVEWWLNRYEVLPLI